MSSGERCALSLVYARRMVIVEPRDVVLVLHKGRCRVVFGPGDTRGLVDSVNRTSRLSSDGLKPWSY